MNRPAHPDLTWTWPRRRDTRGDREGQRGQAMVLFALTLVVILAAASLVIDIGLLRNDRQILINAVGAGALAGGTKMPVDGSVAGAQAAAESLINQTVQADYPGIARSQYTIAYRCLIGVTAGNVPDTSQIPTTCDPSHALGHTPQASDFTGAGPRRSSPCDPSLGDKCNTVVVTGTVSQQFGFGPVVGVDSGSTGAVQSASCNGPCGAVINTPVDVVLILDRTQSMNGVDTANAKSAAQSVVTLYKAKNGLVQLALGTLGPTHQPAGSCAATPDGSIGTVTMPQDLRRWVPVGLTGTTAGFTSIAAAITCYTNSSTGTDLADPITAAAYELLHGANARTGAAKGIILETDGQPNAAVGSVSSSDYCLAASSAAAAAKAQGIEVFTIGFGLDGSNDAKCPDGSGAWHNQTATSLLASMATQPSSDVHGCPGNQAINSNTDNDHFFCLPKTAGASTDLSSVFDTVASQLAQTGPTLISLYPPPIVTAVGSPASPGQSVTITGQYFSGATAVHFDTAPASFTVVSDTQILVTVPGGSGTVDVVVTTGGGSSYQTPADHFTYR